MEIRFIHSFCPLATGQKIMSFYSPRGAKRGSLIAICLAVVWLLWASIYTQKWLEVTLHQSQDFSVLPVIDYSPKSQECGFSEIKSI
jgi:hypothetical protein